MIFWMGNKKHKSIWNLDCPKGVEWMMFGVPIHHPIWFKQHALGRCWYGWMNMLFLCESWIAFLFEIGLSNCSKQKNKALRWAGELILYFKTILPDHPCYKSYRSYSLRWLFGETTIAYVNNWNHPIEPTIDKLMINGCFRFRYRCNFTLFFLGGVLKETRPKFCLSPGRY